MADNDNAQVSIGEILSRAFAAMGDNPLTIFGIAFVVAALPMALFNMLVSPQVAAGALAAGGAGALGMAGFGAGLLSILLGAVVQGALVRATMDFSHGARTSFGEAISVGLSMALPVIGLSILLYLGIILGYILLVVPGIILTFMWVVALPALVAERCGVIAAFGRSRALTKGHRWKIFGLFLLIAVIAVLVLLVFGLLVGATGGFTARMLQVSQGAGGPLMLLVSAAFRTLAAAAGGTIVTSLYISLRNAKDGPDNQALAEVFA